MKRPVIGLFGRVMNNNELCSDWLFHSATHQQEVISVGLYRYKQLYHRVTILYIKRWHQGAVINMQGIETAFERSRNSFTFKRRDSQTLFILWSSSFYHTFHKIRRLSVVLRICKLFAIILIFPYSVYVVSEIFCTVTDTANMELTMSL